MKKRTIFLLSSILLLGGLSVGTLTSCGDQLVEKDSIYTISASVNDDSLGKITLEKTTGKVGEVVKFSIDITPGSNAYVKELKINGSNVDVTTREFTPRKGTNSVVATLAVNTPVVETGTVVIDTKIVNGTVTADKTSGNVGDTINLTITPNSGYEVDTVKANNVALTVENNKASFTLVEGENLVTATFKTVGEQEKTGTVVIDEGIVNGTVTADKTGGVVGEIVNLTITPDSGFKLESLEANHVSLTVENNKASFALIEGENLVTATFVVDQVEPPVQKVDTFYFSDLNGWNGWGSEARVYLFNEDGPVGTAWPGVEMTQFNYGAVGEGINLYKVEDLNYTGATHIVFSTGYIDSNTETYSAQDQTIDIDLTAKGENNYYQLNEEITTESGNRGQGTWLDFATFEETITGTVVLPTEVANGTVSADKLSGYKNDQITLTLTPNENYEVDYVKVNNGENLTVVDNKAIFTLASGVNTVSVAFKEVLPPVEIGTVTIDETMTNGEVSADKLTGNVGDTITLTVTPDEGYELETLKANNEVLTVSDNEATFTLIKGENFVTATFKETVVEPPVQQIGTFYFSDLNGWNSWGSEARVYLFNEDGPVGTAWPGTKLTQFNYGAVSEGVNLYVVEDLDYTGATSIVFSTGRVKETTGEFVLEHQTVDIDLSTKGENNYYQLTSETERKGVGTWLDFATFEETIAGTVVLPTEVANGTVSADKLSGYKNDQITLTLTPDENYEVDYVKVNDGENLAVVDNKATFALASGVNTVSVVFKEVEQEPLPPVQEVETFYFSDLNGWNYVGNYAWVYLYNEEGPVGEAWPGTEMTQVNYGAVGEGINLYKVEDLDYTDATHMVFSTGYQNDTEGKVAQHQTVDIDLSTKGENNYYQLTSETERKGAGTWLDFATFEETIAGTVVLPTEVANGTVNADKLSGYKNDQITLTLTPDENYEVDFVKVNDGENLTVIDSKATFALASGVNTVIVAFKEVTQVVDPEPEENLKEIYLKTPHWWKKEGASTSIQTFYENTDLGPINGLLGEEMEFVSYNSKGDFNYYKATIDLNEVYYFKFIRVGSNEGVLSHWGAETVMFNIVELGDNNLLTIEDVEKWYKDGNYANLEAGIYDPTSDPQIVDYGTYTIYFDPNGVWSEEKIYCYAFGSGKENAVFPGVLMEKVAGTNYYSIKIDSVENQKLIFSNGTAKTSDIEIDFSFGNDASVVATLNEDAKTVTWSLYTA